MSSFKNMSLPVYEIYSVEERLYSASKKGKPIFAPQLLTFTFPTRWEEPSHECYMAYLARIHRLEDWKWKRCSLSQKIMLMKLFFMELMTGTGLTHPLVRLAEAHMCLGADKLARQMVDQLHTDSYVGSKFCMDLYQFMDPMTPSNLRNVLRLDWDQKWLI